MAKLTEVDFTHKPKSVIVFGPPKSGKTELVSKLALRYNLWWFDIENGGETLKKLPLEAQARINYFPIYDTILEPNGIDTMLRVITGERVKFCAAHGKVTCPKCLTSKAALWEEVELSKLNPATDIVIGDSLTQLAKSANAKVALLHGVKIMDGKKFEFDHWNHQGSLLNKLLDLCQNPRFNIVMITHESDLEQEDDSFRIVPTGGTRNFSRGVAKHFGHIIYTDVKNGKHRAAASTTSHNNVLTGSRTDVNIDMKAAIPLLPIFDPKENKALPYEQDTESEDGASTNVDTPTSDLPEQPQLTALQRLKLKQQ